MAVETDPKKLKEHQEKIDEEYRLMDSWRAILLESPMIPAFLSLLGVFLMVIAYFNLYGGPVLIEIIEDLKKIKFMEWVLLFGVFLIIIGIALNRIMKKER